MTRQASIPMSIEPRSWSALQMRAGHAKGLEAKPPVRRAALAGEQWVGGVLVQSSGPLAILNIDGMMSFQPDLFDEWIYGAINTEAVCAALDLARGLETAKGVVLNLNCPGGTCAGSSDVQAAMDRLVGAKPVFAVSHEMMCSAAYNDFCTASEIVGTRTSTTGSIGTLELFYDDSEMFAEMGVVAKPVASDPLKANGWPGVPLDPEFLKAEQRWIDGNFADFANRVAKARSKKGLDVDAVKALRAMSFRGPDAAKNGLIDRVVEYDAFIAELVAKFSAASTTVPGRFSAGSPSAHGSRSKPHSTSPKAGRGSAATGSHPHPKPAAKGSKMSDTNKPEGDGATGDESQTGTQTEDTQTGEETGTTTPAAPAPAAITGKIAGKPATLDELVEAFPGEDAFCFDCLKNKRTMGASQGAWNVKLRDENKALREQLEQAKAAPVAGTTHAGARRNAPVSFSNRPSAAVAAAANKGERTYKSAVLEYCATNKISPSNTKACNMAMATVAQAEPELHKEWCEQGHRDPFAP